MEISFSENILSFPLIILAAMDDSSTIDGDSDDATTRDPSKMYRQKKRKQKKDTHAKTISELRILYVCCPKKEDDAQKKIHTR